MIWKNMMWMKKTILFRNKPIYFENYAFWRRLINIQEHHQSKLPKCLMLMGTPYCQIRSVINSKSKVYYIACSAVCHARMGNSITSNVQYYSSNCRSIKISSNYTYM